MCDSNKIYSFLLQCLYWFGFWIFCCFCLSPISTLLEQFPQQVWCTVRMIPTTYIYKLILCLFYVIAQFLINYKKNHLWIKFLYALVFSLASLSWRSNAIGPTLRQLTWMYAPTFAVTNKMKNFPFLREEEGFALEIWTNKGTTSGQASKVCT